MIWGIAVEIISRSYIVKFLSARPRLRQREPLTVKFLLLYLFHVAQEYRVVITYECHEEH